MGKIIEYAKKEILSLMYQSVERMNQSILDSNPIGIIKEKKLQQRLRSSFEELLNGTKNTPS